MTDVRIKGQVDFPPVNQDLMDIFQQVLDKSHPQFSSQGLCDADFRLLFKLTFRSGCKEWYPLQQWKTFQRPNPRHTLSLLGSDWYHDELIHTITHPYMRLLRKCRLGVSELASHSSFLLSSALKICQQCQQQNNETLTHFFFDCPSFSTHDSFNQLNRYLSGYRYHDQLVRCSDFTLD